METHIIFSTFIQLLSGLCRNVPKESPDGTCYNPTDRNSTTASVAGVMIYRRSTTHASLAVEFNSLRYYYSACWPSKLPNCMTTRSYFLADESKRNFSPVGYKGIYRLTGHPAIKRGGACDNQRPPAASTGDVLIYESVRQLALGLDV